MPGSSTTTAKRMPTVVALLGRYPRWRNCQVPVTWDNLDADSITRLCGDDFHLEAVERTLVHLKRCWVISGRKMAA